MSIEFHKKYKDICIFKPNNILTIIFQIHKFYKCKETKNNKQNEIRF